MCSAFQMKQRMRMSKLFNMITRYNESKSLVNLFHMILDTKKRSSSQKSNNDKVISVDVNVKKNETTCI